MKKEVSIPHRYGKNWWYMQVVVSYAGKFPFLIGTVRTKGAGSPQVGMISFPFLIGTVRTHSSFLYTPSTSTFPFLIGTVRTNVISNIF